MRSSLFLLLFAFVLSSCEKEFLVSESELPEWLKDSIRQDELVIKDNPKSMEAIGSWKRTRWDKVYYYEYFSLILQIYLNNP